MDGHARHIEFEGAGNFRDLGGYETADGRRVRWRRVFRSGQLDEVGEHEATKLLGELGVSTLIDLRHPTEGHANVGAAAPALEAGGVEYVNHSLHGHEGPYSALFEEMRNYAPDRSGPDRSAEIYFEFFVQRRPDQVAAVFNTIAQAGGASVLYCTAGKDRTGVSVALLLSLLGVSDEVIAEDYDLSNLARDRLAAWLQAKEGASEEDIDARRRRGAFGVRRGTIERFLHRFRAEHGGVRAFLEANGVPHHNFERLEDRLLE